MVANEQLARRAAVAARLNADLLSKKFHDRLMSVAPVDEDGDAVVMAADKDESAVVTVHRFEKSPHETIALATLMDDQIRVIIMKHTPEASGGAVSIPGGLSVEGWIRLMDESRNRAFNADGTEFKHELEGISIAML
ncbi:hypothetical protein [Glutamicibacter nicotianae]|uniref:Uncharacterized protein n=1 Tax=Glutamicibacter nicotianae TaxID=37929 RepID=A0ABQ0RLL2_GLUNI|nr:hypothetical protein [Glutamicibacter nicotianae]GEC12697.1 hypothetical protein ANI01nite_19000 [Glutamicibacter nicotianae]